jgi:hypothetical protein
MQPSVRITACRELCHQLLHAVFRLLALRGTTIIEMIPIEEQARQHGNHGHEWQKGNHHAASAEKRLTVPRFLRDVPGRKAEGFGDELDDAGHSLDDSDNHLADEHDLYAFQNQQEMHHHASMLPREPFVRAF